VVAHGLLDQWRLAQAGRGEGLVQTGGVGGQAPLAAGLAQQPDQQIISGGRLRLPTDPDRT
jgi:hypothetical protein